MTFFRKSNIPGDLISFFEPVRKGQDSIFRVNPKPYPGAHFACWPEELVEPMVRAGSSEYGCCSECLAPYARERIPTKVGGKDVSTGGDPSRQDGGARVPDPSGKGGNILATTTKVGGFLPTCDCEAPVQPCTVLDIFSGSATTGAVALVQGRHYIGTDLQPDYLDLAIARLEGRKAPKGADEEPDLIADLFG